MADDNITYLITQINTSIAGLWTSVDKIKEDISDMKERSAKIEVQMSTNKWLIGLIVAQIVAWAFYAIKKGI